MALALSSVSFMPSAKLSSGSSPNLSQQCLRSCSSPFFDNSPSLSLLLQVKRRSKRKRRGSCGFDGFPSVITASSDYYSTLGIPKSAGIKEIKATYRRLARQYHPDVNKQPGATEKFKEISTAYEVLSDDKKRALDDQYGEAGVKSAVEGAGA